MSNPTSNFGWQMPTNSDLVTDLPADFEVFGQAVDTSLADLKGGTTGQILSKASGTDMDFTWINNDQGDITGVTAGTGLTGGGTSGSVTLDYDIANYGNAKFAAGRNAIINGDFGIWQRGTSFSNPSSGSYTADRFSLFYDGSGATRTITQQTFTPATAPVAGYEGQYFWRSSCTVAGSGGTYYIFTQPIEDVRTFAGQTVTVSFWVKADTNRTLTVNFNQNFGSGGSATVYGASSNVSATTSWSRVSATIAVASVSGKTIGTGSALSLVIGLPINATHTVDIWGVQVEAGSTASPFQTATGTKQGELAACQRYYWRSNAAYVYSRYSAAAAADSTTNVSVTVNNPVQMRTAPTSIEGSNLTLYGGGFATLSTATLGADSTPLITIVGITGTGLTQYRAYNLLANNTTNSYFGVSAEL